VADARGQEQGAKGCLADAADDASSGRHRSILRSRTVVMPIDTPSACPAVPTTVSARTAGMSI
jgi:hypothetical protein